LIITINPIFKLRNYTIKENASREEDPIMITYFIVVSIGKSDMTPLPSQDTSPFSINVHYQGNDMNYYVMLPDGTP
jgi:hypothetical protein